LQVIHKAVTMKLRFLFLFLIISFSLFGSDHEDYRVAINLFNDGFYENAYTKFISIINDYPDSVYLERSRYFSGIAQIKTGNIDGAIRILTTLIDKTDFEYRKDLLFNLLVLYSYKSDFVNSDNISRWIDYNQLNPQQREIALYYSVLNKFNTSQLEEGLTLVDQYLQNRNFTRFRSDIYRITVDKLASSSMDQKLIVYADRAISERVITGSDINLFFAKRVRAIYNLGDYRRVIREFTAGELPQTPDILNFTSLSYFMSGNSNAARNLMLQIINTEGINRERLEFVANTYIAENDYNNALNYLLRHRYPEHRAQIGSLYIKLDRFTDAATIYNQMDTSTMSDEEFLSAFTAAERSGNKDMIIRLSEYSSRFENFNPANMNYLYYKSGEICYNNGLFDRALPLFTRWSQLFSGRPESDNVNYIIAVILKEKRDYNRAITYLSLIQRNNRRDEIYYESKVESGEAYFRLYEYGSAIRSFTEYLNQSVTVRRRREVILQTGNAYYNIKDYENAIVYYNKYIDEAGYNNEVAEKIALSLMRSERFVDLITFIDRLNSPSNNINYYKAYGYFMQKNYQAAFDISKNNLTANPNELFVENITICIKSGIALNNYSSITGIYRDFNARIKTLDNFELNRELFGFFLKYNELRSAMNIFAGNRTPLTVITIHSELKKVNRYNEALEFAEIISTYNLVDIAPRDLISVTETFIRTGNTIKAIDFVIRISDFIPANAFNRLFVRAVLMERDTNYLNRQDISNKIKNISILSEYINSFFTNPNRFTGEMTRYITNNNLTDPLVQEAFLMLVRMNIEKNDYNEAIRILSRIPANARNELPAEFRYYEGICKINIGLVDEGISDLLTIHYIFSGDIYFVGKAFDFLLNYFRTSGNTERYRRTQEMFEQNYYKL